MGKVTELEAALTAMQLPAKLERRYRAMLAELDSMAAASARAQARGDLATVRLLNADVEQRLQPQLAVITAKIVEHQNARKVALAAAILSEP